MVTNTTRSLIVDVDYDGDRDVLFACVRPVPKTRSRWAADDLWWLVDDTGGIVGFECVAFQRNVMDARWLRRLPTVPTLYHEGAPNERITLAAALPEVWSLVQKRLVARFGMRPAS